VTLIVLGIEWFLRAPLLVTPLFGVIGRGGGGSKPPGNLKLSKKLKFIRSLCFEKQFSIREESRGMIF